MSNQKQIEKTYEENPDPTVGTLPAPIPAAATPPPKMDLPPPPPQVGAPAPNVVGCVGAAAKGDVLPKVAPPPKALTPPPSAAPKGAFGAEENGEAPKGGEEAAKREWN